MARKLNTTVHVADDNGTMHVFGPGDEVPGWAEKKITNPDVWEGDSGDDAVTFSDPGNSGPASVEMTEGEDTRPTAKEAGSAPASDAPAKSTRQRSGR
ncbi:hypothetical protein [Micromonospora sp. DPT]|uniref:hypothetical protein n=1 Tax=Micromonospora sp. DPT TaxID=3142975 RepID=UPI00320901BC